MVDHPFFKNEWKYLLSLPFRREERVGPSFIRVYRLIVSATKHPHYEWLWLMKDMLLLPHSLWRIAYHGMADRMCAIIEAGQPLDEQFLFILKSMKNSFPTKREQTMIIRVERLIEKGLYESLVGGQAKYDAAEKALLKNPRFQADWKEFRRLFDVEKFKDHYGILRRSLSQERNFPPDPWLFEWDEERGRFEEAFDMFCGQWVLFGLQLGKDGQPDKPLLQKLTINPTWWGWLMAIPIKLSFDGPRDIPWKKFSADHRCRGVMRQGPKMSEGRLEGDERALTAFEASLEMDRQGCTGKERFAYITKQAGLREDTEKRAVLRIIARGRRVAATIGLFAELSDGGTIENIAAASADLGSANLKPQTSNLKPDSAVEAACALIATLDPEQKQEVMKRMMG